MCAQSEYLYALKSIYFILFNILTNFRSFVMNADKKQKTLYFYN